MSDAVVVVSRKTPRDPCGIIKLYTRRNINLEILVESVVVE